MTRPTDWWVLDLDGDPTPGSPSGVRGMARRWHRVADDAAWAQRRMRELMGDEAVGRWIGEAGEVFRERNGELPHQLGKCADSYGQAADALSWWADRLETHQADADASLVRGRAARHELEHAEAEARRAAEHAVAAMGAPVLAGGPLSPSPEQVRDARARLASAQAARDRADAAVADAEARLEAARRMALDARSLREADGLTAADRIHRAAEAAIPERSGWDKLKDWAGEAWRVVVQVAKVVVAVLGVVALLLGGPLTWVVLAASVVLLAEAIAKWRRGESPVWEVLLAALGCIPGTRGLLGADAVASMAAALARPAALASGAGRLRRIGRDLGQTQTARTFTSPDPLVGEVATLLERALPGRIRDVNVHIVKFDGGTREVDIDLDLLVVQVKSGNARSLQSQMRKTIETTGRTVVGYAPDMKPGAWADAARNGFAIARDADELVRIVKELS